VQVYGDASYGTAEIVEHIEAASAAHEQRRKLARTTQPAEAMRKSC